MRKHFVFIAAAIAASTVSALADQQRLDSDTRFCPTWAEAHERTMASLNNGRPPYAVKWKGCIWLKKSSKVDVVKQDAESTEIVIDGKHWFADE